MYSTHALIFPDNSFKGVKRNNLLKFIRYLLSDETQYKFFEKTHRLPVNKNIFNKISALHESTLKACIEQLNLARPMPNSPKMAYVWDGLSIGFDLYMFKKVSEDTAVKFMQKQAEKAWKEANEEEKK